ncbi:MAG: VWA domain-containing protein [Planctomycetota bacterium]
MSFLSPIAALLAAAVTVPLLVGLYFLKLRRRPRVVASTLLWRKAVQDLQVNAPFQRLRNSLLLWLQLLLLALLLLAFARPADEAAAVRGDRVAILIDRSASMSARDGDPQGASRLEAARREALNLIEGLGRDASAMVVSFGDRPVVHQGFTTDRSALRRAVRAIEPRDVPGDLNAALAVLAPLMNGGDQGEQTPSVVVLSDGRFEGTRPIALRGVEVTYLPMGSADTTNVGFVAADARRNADDPGRVEVFARLTHVGPEARDTNVQLWVDGRLEAARRLRLPATREDRPGEGIVRFEVRLPGLASLELRHDAEDALVADNDARLVVTPSRRRRVLLVSPGGNPFPGEAMLAGGVERLDTLTPDAFLDLADDALAGYDLLVLDRWTPAEPITSIDTLSFAATSGIDGFSFITESDADASLQRALTWTPDEPVMRHVALDNVPIRSPGRLVLPVGGRALAMGLSGPLIGQVDLAESGTSHVAVAFDVRESRWPLSWSFQVFMVNALDVLGGGAEGAASWHSAGRPISVPVADASSGPARYVGPGGPIEAPIRGGRATLPGPGRVGWLEAAPATEPAVDPGDARLAVNLLDATESDLRPVSILPVAGSLGGGVTGVAASEQVRREWWPWVLGAALALLCVEWWVYVGRVRV